MKKKFNIVDIAVAILIIIFAVGVGVRYINIERPKTEIKQLTYTVLVEGVRFYTADALDTSEDFSDGVDRVYGEITNVVTEPSRKEYTTSEGTIVKAQVPDKYDCYVTMTSEVKKKDNIYYLDDEQSISVGEELEIITKYVKTVGTIVEVKEG